MCAAPGPFLKASGVSVRNNTGTGDIVPLRGANLGAWLLFEGWMCPMDSSGLADNYSVLQTLNTRFGVATQESLVKTYQDNWITINDLDNIKALGMNVVRLPFWWGNLQRLDGTWRADAFEKMDWLVSNAWQRGIYTLLDFHGVPGGQSASDSTAQANQNQYWTSAAFQNQTSLIWSNIAAHFKNNPAVLGYDLINEPFGAPNRTALLTLYNSLYQTIRAVDPDHIIVLEGCWAGQGLNWEWNVLPSPSFYGWNNVIYSMHAYSADLTLSGERAQIDKQVNDFNSHQSWNVPCLIGEFNSHGQQSAWQYAVLQYNQNNMSWCDWSYKASAGGVGNSWGIYDPSGSFPPKPNIQSDSAADISSKWSQWKTSPAFGMTSFLKQYLGAPLAVADSYTNNNGGTLTVNIGSGVLANDQDINLGQSGIVLSTVFVDGPANGQLTLNPNGSFSYTPNGGFTGTDTFRYRVFDGYVNSANIAAVSIQVGSSTPLIPAQTRVETKADGTGVVVPLQSLPAGSSTTAYAIVRDAGGAFISNAVAAWSLTNKSGGVVAGDLVVAGDNMSATFTAHSPGSAVIKAVASTFTGLSGTLTVNPGLATQLIWTTQPGLATNGLPFGQQPVLKTADLFGNPSTNGLPPTLDVTVTQSAGTGSLSGTTNHNLGATGGKGVINFSNLQINSAGASKQLTASASGIGSVPTSIANCQLWLDAGDLNTLTLGGTTTVTTWADKSGNGNNATAGTAPTLVTNASLLATGAGRGRALRFDGTSTYLNVNLSFLSGQPYTIFALEVSADKGSSDSYVIGNEGSTANQALHMGYRGNIAFRLGQWANDLDYAGSFTGTTTPRVWCAKLDTGAGHFIYLNGAQTATSASTVPVTGSLNLGHIGKAFATAASIYKGDLAEIVVYNRALSDAERNQIESYLNGKWLTGFPGAVTAPFTVYASTGGPSNGIAGITNNGNGTFKITFAGTVGTAYYVQSATNLPPPIVWSPEAGSTNTVTNGNGQWFYTVTNTKPQRYYRSVTANP